MGAAGMAVGAIWSHWFPINKNLWTSSFVVYTAGFALVFLSLLYWIIEIRGWRGRWTMPFLAFGMNAIVAYCFDELLWAPLYYGHARAADGSVITWQQYLNGSIASDNNKPMLLWQVPVGNQYFQTENNTDGHFQDNRAETQLLTPSQVLGPYETRQIKIALGDRLQPVAPIARRFAPAMQRVPGHNREKIRLRHIAEPEAGRIRCVRR